MIKQGGVFFICNELDGLNPSDGKWTKKIDGMTIYTAEQLGELLNPVGFASTEVDNDTSRHRLCIKAKK